MPDKRKPCITPNMEIKSRIFPDNDRTCMELGSDILKLK
jgi:hypothetical protein